MCRIGSLNNGFKFSTSKTVCMHFCNQRKHFAKPSLLLDENPIKVVTEVSKLVGALSPVNHKGLHQGCTQTSLDLQVIHFTSHHTTSHVFFCWFFIAYLYSAGAQHGNLHLAGWPILFCRPTQEPWVSHSQHRKNREEFWKKCRWMDQKCRNKQGRKPWQ